jgi:hypothetical protein
MNQAKRSFCATDPKAHPTLEVDVLDIAHHMSYILAPGRRRLARPWLMLSCGAIHL